MHTENKLKTDKPMAHTERHERLTELPLFQGMSPADIEQITATTRFGYLNYPKGKTIVSDGDACSRLLFLVKGTVSATGHADDNGYEITETFSAPDVLQPERIFGLTQRHTRTFRTVTDCHLISLDKIDTFALAERYEIFRLNLLNIVCTQSQRLARNPWRTRPKDIRRKIARFIETRCLRPAGGKTVRIKMQRLAEEIGESRLNVSQTLNMLAKEGVISLKRGEIHVFALEKIIR